MGGIATIQWLKERNPNIVVITLTHRYNDPRIINAMQAGASSYILKEASAELLLHIIRTFSVTLFSPKFQINS